MDCMRGANAAIGIPSGAIAASTAGGAADGARAGNWEELVDGGWGVKGGWRVECVRGANAAIGTPSSAIAASTAGRAADRARKWDEGVVDGVGWGGGGTTEAADVTADRVAGGSDQTVAIRRENGVKRLVLDPAGTVAVAVTGDRSGPPPLSPAPPRVRRIVLSLSAGCGASA